MTFVRTPRVVVTRSRAQAADMAARLQAAGLVPVLFPVIAFAALPAGALDAALDRLAAYRWLVFTSVNGVEFFFARLEKRQPPPALPRVAAVGSATAEALAARGVVPDFMPETFTGEALARGLGALAGQRVLLPRAKMGRPQIVALLEAQGAAVDDVALYDTVTAVPTETAVADLTAGFDALTFTSPSSVRNFWRIVDGLETAVGAGVRQMAAAALVACIGPSTSDEARRLGMRVAVQPDEYTIDGLVAAVAAYFLRRPGFGRHDDAPLRLD